MIGSFRNFAKSKFAGILVGIIIIPFVFWGMGSVFSSGNLNSLAKVNNHNISTDDFISHINNSRIDNQYIRQNIDNEIIERLVNDLVSTSIINLEIKDQNLFISDKNLADLIKKNNIFFNENGEFSRIKYEKYLLENNFSVGQFEYRFKNNELKKKLFQYISGGVKSPYFLTNKIYKNKTKKINIKYINLNNIYKKKDSFTKLEVDQFINDNKEKLKIDYIDFSYAKLTPKNLSQSEEFTDEYFAKIDLIENEILNGKKIKDILLNYNIDTLLEKNYSKNDKKNEIFEEIYERRREETIQLLDKNDYFLIYEIENINNIIPKKDEKFLNIVRDNLYEMKKYEVNKNFFEKIQNKELTLEKFMNLVKNNNLINETTISSDSDNKLFSKDSLKLLYAMGNKSFLLMSDNDNNVYLSYINNISADNIIKNNSKIKFYADQSSNQIKDTLYNSYDYIINKKYNVDLNKKTLERLKNHFK